MQKLILGFSGEMASGKGTAAKYLEEKYGAKPYRFSAMLFDIANRLHLPLDRDSLQRISMSLRHEFGEDLLAKVMFEDAKHETNPLVVIDGVRRLEDVRYLRELPEFRLCFIAAPMKLRYERMVKRGEKADDTTKTFAEFEDDHERESEREIVKLEPLAAEIIDNAGTLPELYAQIDAIVTKYSAM